ncbi:LEAF RUST 10 DISEASE-RESISTANCE LOCUS RECEPTOR-LIKE PROTEIN KINASE-like 2.1 [Iris pallida]|uniref:LEAF RUST 10 DISEASE-RESISTANCE LOCUS RECEPTOR-LIKE PROTEIN KINASE-like 2.1 n=1 Tax=Iris pallida TaxID=29817 RepID=A0AAX6FB74_IRIPA|nr:LEAF RUST 10 DISEASE-RESISTANCE LOCUS RECEPTOR-LIKE PROTEIN KINASE-like 2.1 [Iris pallida]
MLSFLPMALLFLLLLLLFFLLLPSFSHSCPTIHPLCDSDIDIYYPFYTNNSLPGCNGTYLVHCDDSSTPTVQFQDYLRTVPYPVKNISYSDKTITIQQYPQFTTLHPSDSKCSFLYEFKHPIPHFDTPHLPIIDDLYRYIPSCEWEGRDFPLLGTNYKYSVCTDFSFYFWTELENGGLPRGVSPVCRRARRAPLLEFKLSFSRPADGLSLLSAGFSHYLELHPDCFEKKLCHKTNHVKKTGIAIVGGTVALVTACCIVICCYYLIYRKKTLNNDKNVENFLKKHGSLAPNRYKYSDVKKITESFRNKLGQGGYGSVFKGTLIDGRLVAVKVLSDSKGNGEDFFNEIASTGRSSHVNVVNLLGFCSEGSKRALIYEYMCNGSLDKLICSKEPKTTLRWEKLYQIAIGIARGLEYLHRGCNTRIVHFDIKPHNILLDEDFRPKISDFGLCKLCLRNDSILSMEGTRGTAGYIAPELFCRNFGVVSSKSDIYSYGMMVLEMAGGRENIPLDVQNTSETYFPFSIYKHLDHSGGLRAYGATAETEEVVRKMILVGLWCIQTMPQNRPSITKVIEMLEGSIDDLQVPPKPNLSFPSSFGPIMDISSCSHDGCSSAVH